MRVLEQIATRCSSVRPRASSPAASRSTTSPVSRQVIFAQAVGPSADASGYMKANLSGVASTRRLNM
ncbi:hypothetical protein TLA_TLA_00730 [Tessaracoccus lapidicaptus]|nr:hypothetical protein TLA_TLA_00730 [Tessaracoccus lapidicaptus]